MNDLPQNILEKIKSYFLVWSWASTLAAYLTTSAIFSNQLFSLSRQGFDLNVGVSGLMLSMLFASVSIAIIAMGWLIFLKYSVLIYEHAISDRPLEPEVFLHSFSASLRYLVLSWVAALVGSFAPLIFLVFRL